MNTSTPDQGIPRPPPLKTELPQPLDPSAGVRLAGVVREGLTDLAGVALAGYLATKAIVPGTWALGFVLVLLLPSPVLLRLAKIAAARGGGGGAALALVGASVAYSHLKTGAVVVTGAAVALGACL